MDEAKKKQLQQIIILVVVLVLLGVAVAFSMKRTGGGAASRGATSAAASKPATNMAAAGMPPKSGASSVPLPAGGRAAGQLNPNMWRVYALTPPKNPFMQQESWYAATFSRLLPGYPWLRTNGFFDKPSDVLPNINALFGKGVSFKKIELQRHFKDRSHVLSGVSEDDRMTTTLTAEEKTPPDVDLVFDGNGNPVRKDVTDGPELVSNLGPDGKPIEGSDIIPLGPLGGGGVRLDGLGAPGVGESLAVHGISIHSKGRASALLKVNGSTRIVGVGDALAPRYVVTKISKSGVELKDTKSGTKKFVELKAPSKDSDSKDMPLISGLGM
jgi:hypothetical protein